MQVETDYVSALDASVQALVSSQSPSDIFKILLKGSQSAAPRGTIFLVRQSAIKGWGSIGYDEATAKSQRGYRGEVGQGWLGELIVDTEGPMRVRSSGGDPDFGQAAASDAAAIAVRVKGRAIAVLMIERSAGETSWQPSALQLLVSVAQLRLELDLALRKLKAGAGALAAASAPPVEAPAPAPSPIPKDVSVEPPGLEPQTGAVDEVPETLAEDAEVAAARRFAKLVATDIRLYNEEAVMLGRREKDLVARLGDQLGRGKETFLKRHGSMGSAATEILHAAYVEVLAAGDEELLPASVLD